jgi:predicted kinase
LSISAFKRDDRANEKVNRVVLDMARSFLNQGYSVIVEQGFREGWVEMYQTLGSELKVKTITVQLQVPRDILLQRVSERNRQPHPTNKPRVPQSRVLRNIRKQLNKSPVESIKIDSSVKSAKEVAAEVARLIRGRKRF